MCLDSIHFGSCQGSWAQSERHQAGEPHHQNGKTKGSTYTWNSLAITDLFGHQSFANLPGKDRGALALEHGDLSHNFRRGNARFAAADRARLHRSRLEVAAEYFAHASVGNLQNARNVAGARAVVRELHYLESDVVGQWAPVDVGAAELVDSGVAYW